MMRARRLAAPLIAICAIAAAVSAAGVAYAHARMKSSVPAKGEVVAASPAQVSLTFSQEIQKITGTYGITVSDAGGADVTAAPAAVNDADRTNMTVALRPSLPAGRYVVAWKNVSDADGDPAEGAFAFYVGRQPTAAELAEDAKLPGEEEETPVASVTAAASPTRAPAGSATAAAPSAPDGDGGGANVGLIVGIAAGALAVAVVAGGAAYWLRRGRA